MKKLISLILTLSLLIPVCITGLINVNAATFTPSKSKLQSPVRITQFKVTENGFGIKWEKKPNFKGYAKTSYNIRWNVSKEAVTKNKCSAYSVADGNKTNQMMFDATKYAGQKIYIKIQAVYRKNNTSSVFSNWSNIKTIVPLLPKPSITKISPGKKKVTVTWTKETISGIGGYEVKCWQANNPEIYKTKTFWNNKTTKCTIPNLRTNKKYYVKVRTWRECETDIKYSKWSSAKVVVIK